MSDMLVELLGVEREQARQRLRCDGVVVVRNVFSQDAATALAHEAQRLKFELQPAVYGSRSVQQAVACADIAPRGRLWEFADAVEIAMQNMVGDEAMTVPLGFNRRVVQWYRPETIGIGSHRDESRYRNLVVLCGLSGYGRFKLFRGSSGALYLTRKVGPGDVVVMIAPGFNGRDDRPVHAVDQIQGERYVLALRRDDRA